MGGCSAEDRDYAMAVKREALGLPAHVHFSAPGAVLNDLLARGSIYWHAGGLGEDPDTHPDRFEHFGISVVEAMSAGLVPVVFGAAGPAEVVRDGVDGAHFATVDELVRDDGGSRRRRVAPAGARRGGTGTARSSSVRMRSAAASTPLSPPSAPCRAHRPDDAGAGAEEAVGR